MDGIHHGKTQTSKKTCARSELIRSCLCLLRQELRDNFEQHAPRWTNNLSRVQRNRLRELEENPTVRVLTTDKNLGPALVSTEWVEQETLKHLIDTASYAKVTKDDWTIRRQKVIETRERLINSYSSFLPPNWHKFLRSLDNNPRSLDPTKFYIIPKIHKSPEAGTPIESSHSYITKPISIFVDELVKPSINMPTMLRDSGELIQCLENIELPANCLLVTADVSSLYPNIDTKKAIIAVDLLLREGKVAETPLLVQLTRLIFENNFLKSEFSCDIYHQTFGIATGTPFAVTAANAFMYYHERDIIELGCTLDIFASTNASLMICLSYGMALGKTSLNFLVLSILRMNALR